MQSDSEYEYNIVEIFHSVQGEGAKSGIPHVFVRFGKCNLACEWCDTDFNTFEKMTVDMIVERVLAFNCNNVIYTGGEPLLNDLWPLSRELKKHDIHLSCESNGTVKIPEGLLDWICISPKDQEYPNVSIKQRTGDELKCVYVGQDLQMYNDLKQGFDYLFLQPCYIETESVEWNGKNFAMTESIVKDNPEWRLSLQTHKWMQID
jgi:7-carboxy-7-deazaguanine synthase